MNNKRKKINLHYLVTLLLFLSSVYPSLSLAEIETESGYKDPYGYNQKGESQVPAKGTHYFNNTLQKETVNNFDFSSNNDAINEPSTKQLLKENTFEGGYHENLDSSGNVSYYSKKLVKPTENPNIFEIQLDVLKGKEQMTPKVDIAFVIDKSGSMNFKADNSGSNLTRWDVLKDSFNRFSNRLLPDQSNNYRPSFDTRFALSSFSSIEKTLDYDSYIWWYGEWFQYPTYQVGMHFPRVDIEKYNSSYFTSNKELINDSVLFRDLPNGGTPTFFGVDAGVELLRNNHYGSREDAHKFLIFITDGEPTFDRNSLYPELANLPNRSVSPRLDTYLLDDYEYKDIYTTSGEDELRKYYPVPIHFIGDGSQGGEGSLISFEEKYNELLSTTKDKFNTIPNVTKYSIGIGDEVSKFEDILELIGDDKSYKVSKNIGPELEKVFAAIEADINEKAFGDYAATIIDPMSKFVTLKQDSIKDYDLVVENQEIQVTERTKNLYKIVNGEQITVNDLMLTRTDEVLNGYRLVYQVELKPEYRNGNFYPANGPTYLYDESDNSNGVGFAVPSIKNNSRDILVEKEWKGSQSSKPTITLILKANSKEVDRIDLVDGETNHIFKNFPIIDEDGEIIDYSIEEVISDTEHKYMPEIIKDDAGNFKVINTPMGDFITTKIATKKNLKPGEEFTYIITVKNTVKDSLLKELLVEDTMPEGIEIVGNLRLNGEVVEGITGNEFKVTIPELKGEEEAKISVDVKASENASEGEIINVATVTNPEDPDKPKKPEEKVEINRELELSLLKTDINGKKILKGASFELYQVVDEEEKLLLTHVTDDIGKLSFDKLKSGSYIIKEKTAPDGYKLLEKPIHLTIDKKGVMELKDTLSEKVSLNKAHNLFELTVKNEKEEPPTGGLLPETGGKGNSIFTTIAITLMLVTISLSVYYWYRSRKGWQS